MGKKSKGFATAALAVALLLGPGMSGAEARVFHGPYVHSHFRPFHGSFVRPYFRPHFRPYRLAPVYVYAPYPHRVYRRAYSAAPVFAGPYCRPY